MKRPNISVIVPVHNEANTIKETIERAVLSLKNYNHEIIVIDDGSSDGSYTLAKRCAYQNVILLKSHSNKGKGNAIRKGIKNAKGNIIMIQDADLEYPPEQLPKMIKLMGESDILYGSRYLKKQEKRWSIPHHYLGNMVINSLMNMLYGTKLTDVETGMKCFSKRFLDSIELQSNDFRFEVEVTIEAIKKGYMIQEVAIDYIPRGWREGKKISWIDGIKAICLIFTMRLK